MNSLLGLWQHRRGAGHSLTKVGWSLAPWSTAECAAWPHIVSLSAILAPQCNWNQSSKQPLLFLKDAHHQFLSAEIGLFVFFGPVWQKLEIDLVPKSIRCAPLTPANHSSIGIKAPSTIHLFCPIFAPKTTTLQCFISQGFMPLLLSWLLTSLH